MRSMKWRDIPPPAPPIPVGGGDDEKEDDGDSSDGSLYKLQHQFLADEINEMEDEQEAMLQNEVDITLEHPTDDGGGGNMSDAGSDKGNDKQIEKELNRLKTCIVEDKNENDDDGMIMGLV